jgi:hypothetical protein
MFDFLFEPNPAFAHAAAICLMIGGSLTMIIITMITLNKDDRDYKKSHKTKKA